MAWISRGGDAPGQHAGDEAAVTAGWLEDARPAPADRPETFQNRGRQLRRSLEIAKVASHRNPPPHVGLSDRAPVI